MTQRAVFLLASFVLVAGIALSQPGAVTLDLGPTYLPGGGQSGSVRSSTGALYVLGALDNGVTRPITIFRSIDQGASWAPFVTSGINDASSGESGANLVNVGSLAIDGQDRLHIMWKRAYYPTFYNSYYRSFDLGTGTIGPLMDVNATFGIATTSRDASSAIAVASDERVWMTAPSLSSWREQLLVSNQPFAASGGFTTAGVCTSTGASAQNTRIAIDAQGLVHCVFYRNTSSGEVAHRYYDPVNASWSPETSFGNTTPPQDNYADVCADFSGTVHVLYCVDASGGTITPRYEYRSWSAASGFSAPIVVASFTNAQTIGPVTGQSSTAKAADIACNEATGDVFVVMRDFANGGGLVLLRKGVAETTFTRSGEIAPPNPLKNHYYAPYFRGRMNPSFDNTGSDLDIVWRENGAVPVATRFTSRQGSPLAVVQSVGTGCGFPTPALAAPLPILGDAGFTIDVVGGPANGGCYLFFAVAPAVTPGTSVGSPCFVGLDVQAAAAAIASGESPIGPLLLDGGGGVSVGIPLVYDPIYAGIAVSFQAYCLAPGLPFFHLSDTLDFRLGF